MRETKNLFPRLLKLSDSYFALIALDRPGEDSIILSVISKIKVSTESWLAGPEKVMKNIVQAHAAIGDVVEFQVKEMDPPDSNPNGCKVCGWIHDSGFTRIKIPGQDVISLAGILPEIVSLVHRTLENGLASLSTKDNDLLAICGGYRNPCKAFDDLKRRDAYKLIFDTRRRGFIALRHTLAINRNKSKAHPE